MEIIGVKTKGLHSCWAGGRLDTRYNENFNFTDLLAYGIMRGGKR